MSRENSHEIAQRFSKLQKLGRKGRCMFVEADGRRCTNNSISSHTIQESGALSTISEGGHVYKIGINMFVRPPEHPISFKRIGKSKASVFPGFCKRHDNDLFAPIETQGAEPNLWAAFLLTYRAICMELFAKEQNVKIYTDPVMLKLAKDTPDGEANFRVFLEGTRLGIKDLLRTKIEYESSLHSKNLVGFTAKGFVMTEDLPLCFAAPIAPEYDFEGNRLLPSEFDRWDSVGIFSGTFGDRNILIIGGFIDDRAHQVRRFIETFGDIPFGRVGDVALNIALELVENTFYRPSWVDSLTNETRTGFIHRFANGVPGDGDTSKARLGDSNHHINIPAITEIDFSPN